jgi:hypothetical protein
MDECFWDSLCDCNDYMDYYNDYMYTNEEQDEEIEYTFDEISTLINGKFGECIIRAALNTGSMFIREIVFPVYNIHAELEYKDTKGYIYYERESIIEEVSFE